MIGRGRRRWAHLLLGRPEELWARVAGWRRNYTSLSRARLGRAPASARRRLGPCKWHWRPRAKCGRRRRRSVSGGGDQRAQIDDYFRGKRSAWLVRVARHSTRAAWSTRPAPGDQTGGQFGGPKRAEIFWIFHSIFRWDLIWATISLSPLCLPAEQTRGASCSESPGRRL